MRDIAAEFLAVSALPEDIIIASDCDEMISYEGFKKFDPIHDEFASTEVRYYHFYFNRECLTVRNSIKDHPNYQYNTIKIVTYEKFKKNFESLSRLRRTLGCNLDVVSN